MDWIELLRSIAEVCLVPLLGVLTAFLVQFIQTKQTQLKTETENETIQKYVDLLGDTIVHCVMSTNQTYVNELKDKDLFDVEAQQEAFRRTFNNIMEILSDEAQIYLAEIYGDLNTYIKNKIESTILAQKINRAE